MSLAATADPIPLEAVDEGRVIRVRGTRVTLDAVVGAFQRGSTPEEIAQDHPSVSLADAYAVIAYYLRHRSEVEAYLERRRGEHAELRREIEATPEHQELRDRLRARIDRARASAT